MQPKDFPVTTTLRGLLSLVLAVLLGGALLASPATAEPAAAPQLVSWSADPGPHRLGDSIELRFEVTNPERLHRIETIYREKTTGQWHAFQAYWDLSTASGTGTVTYDVPTDPVEGPNDVTYRVEMVALQDVDGRWSRYYEDGSFGSETLPGMSHDVDLTSQLSFVETGRDHTPPVLHSLAVSPSDVATGGKVTIGYSSSDLNNWGVTVLGKDQQGRWVQLAQFAETPLPGAGSATWSLETPDKVTVARVDVADVYGNIARYYPDGRLTWGMAHYPERGVGTHEVAMPQAPIAVRPQPVSGLTAQPRSGSARLSWTQQSELGYRVVVNPGGRVLTGEPGSAARDLVVGGLTNGTPHTFTVTTTGNGVESSPTAVTATPRLSAMRVFGTGDRNKDGRADLWAAPSVTGATSAATWRIYHGAGGGTFGRAATTSIPATRAPIPGSSTGRGPGASLGALYLSGSDLVEPTAAGTRVIGKGFNVFSTIDASSDLTSDGIADLIGITPAGDFYVYPSTATGGIGRGVRLGSGWAAFQAVFSPGDLTGDARSDVVGVDALGKLWLYPGSGRGGFGARTLVGSGWATFGAVLPMRDFSGDGKVDLGAITTDGRLVMFPGNGRGGFLAWKSIGSGWGVFL